MSEAKRESQPTAPDADNRLPASRAWWRLPLLLAVVLVAIVAARSSQTRTRGPGSPATVRPQPSADAAGKTVALTIRFSRDKERRFENVAWRPGMTVDDLLSVVSQQPGSISYAVIGVRETMLVTQIDDISNDNQAFRFWTYSVNDKPADRSLGVYELQPGDRVLWTYGRPQ